LQASFNSTAPALILLYLITLTAFAASLTTVCGQESKTAASGPPNILLINADDLGWGDPGFMGSDFYETPNLDRLASEGVVFTHAYAGAANCAPSRAVLLTGLYSPRHEIYNVGAEARGEASLRRVLHIAGTDTLHSATPTWARLLADAGWRLGHFGKWHLGADPAAGPVAHGFHVNVGGNKSGGPPNYFAPFRAGVPGLGGESEGAHIADVIARAAAAFMAENAGRSWLAYVPFFDVHTPIKARQDLIERYEQKTPGQRHHHVVYAAMVHAMDEAVGVMLAALEASGQADRTMVVFTSDNGGYGPVTNIDPLRGYKGTYYEGGIRVPMVVRWPARVAPGRVSEVPVAQVDLFPTFCEIAGAPLPRNPAPDGASLVTLLTTGRDDALAERSLFWHFPAYLQSYARADSQRDPHFRSRPVTVMRRGDWKLLLYHEEWCLDGGRDKIPDNRAVELFDLTHDPGETRDLAAENPARLDALLDELLAWLEETSAPLASEPNPTVRPDPSKRKGGKGKGKAKAN
jgi:arylsulfatase A-like enzyme